MRQNTVLVGAVVTVIGLIFMLWHNYRERELDYGISLAKEERYKEALDVLRPYADRGDSAARDLVGRIYAFGLGVQPNREEARKWLSCGRIKGCVRGKSEYFLAKDYVEGVGVEKNRTEALFWMEVSKQEGYEPAKDWLSSKDELDGSL